MSIQRVVALLVVLAGVSWSSAADRQPRVVAPPLTYNVWLDGRRMGTQHYSFESAGGSAGGSKGELGGETAGDELVVISHASFNVKILFVTVFDYDHKAIERWQGNCLQAVASVTTTNGEEEFLNLELPANDCAGTYAYWDKQRLQRKFLTNAQTGKREPAQWLENGLVSLPRVGKRKSVQPNPGLVTGIELTTPAARFELFYDSADQLLMLQTINDGRTITYLLDSLDVK